MAKAASFSWCNLHTVLVLRFLSSYAAHRTFDQQYSQEPSYMATSQKTARKPNAAFMKPLTPSATLAAVIGSEPVPRTEVTKKIWDYIKKHDLQDPKNRRNINADDKLRPLFGKDQVSMFELTKLVSAHLK